MATYKGKTVQVRVTEEMAQKFKKVAEAHDLTVSEYLRYMVIKEIEKIEGEK